MEMLVDLRNHDDNVNSSQIQLENQEISSQQEQENEFELWSPVTICMTSSSSPGLSEVQ